MRKNKTRINFIPQAMRQTSLSFSNIVIGALAFAALVPFFGLALSQVTTRYVTAQLNQTQRIAALESQIQVKIAERSGGDSAVIRSVQQALAERQYWAEVFKELGNIGPEKVWLTNFSAKLEDKTKKVVITGNSASQAEIAEFYARLEKSFYFRNLHIRFTEATKDIVPQIYHFEFEGTLFEPNREVADGKI